MACGQLPGKLKPALPPEHDIHQDNLRPQLRCPAQRLSRGRGNADDAQASVIDMRADGCDGALTLSISDDGIGGADPSRGSGIIGLKDRVEALGGTISVLSPPGHGTILHVQLPADPMAVPTLPGGTL